MSVKIEKVTPAAMTPLDQLEGDALLIRVAQIGEVCVMKLADDSRYLSKFCDKLDQGEVWRKVSPTWEDFCQKAFGHPASYVQAIRRGVALLDKGDDSPVPANDALSAEKKVADMAEKVPPLEKNGTNQHKLGFGSPKPSAGNQNSEYLVARIKRDRPDIAERMVKGEFKSVKQAALEAGIKVRHTVKLGSPETVAQSILRLQGEEYVDALIVALTTLRQKVP